jgi:hypothetical protein
LVDILNEDEIVIFESGRYCDGVKETIMELLSLNISMNKVNCGICTVIQKLAMLIKKIEEITIQTPRRQKIIKCPFSQHTTSHCLDLCTLSLL